MNNDRISLVFTAPDLALLQELRDAESDPKIQAKIAFGTVAEVPPPSRLDFDVFAAIQVAYQVITVIGTIGGTIQFIDWLIEKIEAARKKGQEKTVLVSRGAMQSLISTTKTTAENRAELNRLLPEKP